MSQRDDDGGAGGSSGAWEASSWQETSLQRRDSAHDEEGDDDAALDALLRRSMRALDERVPEALFEELPAKVDARLSDGADGAGIEVVEVDDEEAARSAARGMGRHARTEVLGPWWHSRGMMIGVGLASVAAAAALVAVVARRGGGEHGPAMGASSIREPGSRRAGAWRAASEVEEPDAVELERRAVLAELAPVLPAARACVGARPAVPISLDLTVSREGVIRDVVVQGPLPELAAARCIADAIHRLDGKLAPRERPQSVRVPLF